MSEELIGTAAAAPILGVEPKTLERMARARDIPVRRIGREWKFLESELIAWRDGLKTGPKA